MDNGWETDDDGGLNSRGSKKIGTSEVRDVMRHFKETFRTHSPGMDNTFWDPFPVKLCKLLHKMVILQKNWTCQSN